MSDSCGNPGASKLALPVDSSLPVFVYGTLMEGQPGFHQLEKFTPRVSTAQLPGLLYLRDGLPLLDMGNGGPVSGQLLEFPEEFQEQALNAICQFEPEELYKWCQVETTNGVRANALQGRHLNRGGAEPAPGNRWSLDMDPVFSDALNVVRASADAHAAKAFPNSPENVDWNRAFHIQMAYLLLWSVVERFSALAVGPTFEPHKRVTALGQLSPVVNAVSSLDARVREVSDSRKPKTKYVLDVHQKPKKAMDYYYAVRSNLSHRGKGAWRDAETVRLSLNELLTVMTAVLKKPGKQNP